MAVAKPDPLSERRVSVSLGMLRISCLVVFDRRTPCHNWVLGPVHRGGATPDGVSWFLSDECVYVVGSLTSGGNHTNQYGTTESRRLYTPRPTRGRAVVDRW